MEVERADARVRRKLEEGIAALLAQVRRAVDDWPGSSNNGAIDCNARANCGSGAGVA